MPRPRYRSLRGAIQSARIDLQRAMPLRRKVVIRTGTYDWPAFTMLGGDGPHRIFIDISTRAVLLTLMHEWAHCVDYERRGRHPCPSLTPLEADLEMHDDEYWKIHGEIYRAVLRLAYDDSGCAARKRGGS